MNSFNIEQLNKQLFESAWVGDIVQAKQSIEQGANIDSLYGELKATPLYGAARNNQPEMVELLISEGANLEIAIIGGATPLYTAALNCFPEVTRILLKNNANKEVTIDGFTPLFVSIKQEYVLNVAHLLEYNAEVYNDTKVLDGTIYNPILISSFISSHKHASPKAKAIHHMVLDNYWENYIPKVDEKYPNAKTFDDKLEVVVIGNEEDLSWISREFPFNKVTIYNMGNDYIGDMPDHYDIISINEISSREVYLQHILNNYEDLVDRAIFIRGEPYGQNIYLPLIKYKDAEILDAKDKFNTYIFEGNSVIKGDSFFVIDKEIIHNHSFEEYEAQLFLSNLMDDVGMNGNFMLDSVIFSATQFSGNHSMFI